MIYCYDIDGTICQTPDGNYERAVPIPQMIAEVNGKFVNGHKVIFFTARGSETGKDWRLLTEKQLAEWGVWYHELHFGKPFADCYVDDRAIPPPPRTIETAAIIQARMGSTRLPGKVMMDIADRPLLAHVIERARAAVDNVFLVTTPDSLEIIEFAEANSIPYSLDRRARDVLDSYYHCASRYGIEHIIRITADNPLIDPEMIKKLIRFYNEGGYDWAANCRLKVTYPIGNDAEIFSFKTLEQAWQANTTNLEREHVTPYIYNHPELFKLSVMENDKDESHLRWTVDTEEDLERVRGIYKERELCLTHG